MLIFSLTTVFTALLVAGWAILCIYRLFFSGDTSRVRHRTWRGGPLLHDKDAVPVGVREIYEQTHKRRAPEEIADYSYERGSRANLPSAWWEDLQRRRN
jgi:hypothetical protein